jgi:chorismate dehydratase
MARPRIRIGAVSYLNTRPLVHGLENGLLADRIELSYAPPSRLADELAAGDLDIALLPVIELARIPDLELAPGLGIVCRGATRSVLLVSRVPLDQVRRVALDPESRTSNALVRVLFARVWGGTPSFATGPLALEQALEDADAAVRIGDKALFEPVPEGCHVVDLGSAWTDATGLPFVFAAWACRPGVLDRALYRGLHASRREGSSRLDDIARRYVWEGRHDEHIARAYLRENIRFRLGAEELRALRSFLRAAHELGIIEREPEVRLALHRLTPCHERAEALLAEGDSA